MIREIKITRPRKQSRNPDHQDHSHSHGAKAGRKDRKRENPLGKRRRKIAEVVTQLRRLGNRNEAFTLAAVSCCQWPDNPFGFQKVQKFIQVRDLAMRLPEDLRCFTNALALRQIFKHLNRFRRHSQKYSGLKPANDDFFAFGLASKRMYRD